MKRPVKDCLLAVVGFVLAVTGLILVKAIPIPQGIMRALPFVLIGVGCGVFGQGMGNIIGWKVVKDNPQVQKQIEIEKNDERNVAIANRAKAKSYDMMIFVYGALMVAFALMGVDLFVILLLAAAYLFVVFYGIYYRSKYDREM
jgi:hypothetical protein